MSKRPAIGTKEAIAFEVRDELDSACVKHEPFNSAHEGFSVMLEEVDELWEEVKKRPTKRDVKAMRQEAIQVAAMAMRFILDCCSSEEK